MGSSSQHYRDTAPASTEDWENVTAHPASTEGIYWQREARHPDWEQAVSELHWVWDLHVYGMASLFSVLSVLCLLTVLRLNAQLSERPHLSSLNIFLGILAFSRLIVLFADPYGTTQSNKRTIGNRPRNSDHLPSCVRLSPEVAPSPSCLPKSVGGNKVGPETIIYFYSSTLINNKSNHK
ncbi:uncharacterized protein TNCV_3640411 [Trichonephila clavipes]|nr:uncharacterized protein TNCV_3640411 [Trichonephila clavipes]